MAEAGAIAILTVRGALQYALVNALRARFAVGLVVYERQDIGKYARLLLRRARRQSLGRTLGQLAYVPWDRLIVRQASARAVAEMLAGHDTAPPPKDVPQLDVDSVNGEAAARALEAARPAVVVVLGTSIIKPHILAKAPAFLNVHAGITPRYRGAHGAFWAVWEGRPDLAGVTVHVVDAGIDTGGIVAQAPIPLQADDTPRTLAARQTLAGLPLLIEAVARALAGDLATHRRADLESRLWHSPTPLDYLQFRRRLRRLRQEGKLGPRAGPQQKAT